MKKHIFITLFSVLLMLGLIPMWASAATIERLTPENPDYASVTACAERVAEYVEMGKEIAEMDSDSVFVAENIDWSRAYRVYSSENDIFQSADVTLDDLKAQMDYVWVLPVTVDGTDMSITISIGLPPDEGVEDELSAEEYEQLLEDVGKWKPVVVELVSTTAETYEQKLEQDGLGDAQDVLLVGGSPKLRSHAVIAKDAQNQLSVDLMAEPAFTGELRSEEAGMVSEQSDETLQEDTVYSFAEVVDVMAQYDLPDNDKSAVGSGGAATEKTQRTKIAIVAVIAAGCIVFVLFRQKKRA